ncbi:dTMP kinase [Mycoplasma testudineum]|uniref:Thymidylate kinase n=1 Tax=Mycoplasma testudineum TaxID=244584 RepID=A0A4R6IDJ9_9MOLU|nr:dTMP kinase [Mycoplasma testudineum]OYD26809.1 dTMP kinase [Mycoplasma testudineum]TDO20343.1 dTMP kinase [Mycoplasma testudineum]
MLITFEGMDGAGKTSIMNLIHDELVSLQKEKNFIFTREPGGAGITEAEQIRNVILDSKNRLSDISEALLYSASRRIHIDRIIEPNYDSKIIFSDRYIDSFYAYQGYGRNLGIEWTKKLTELIIGKFKPDLTFFIDISYEQTISRRNNREQAKDRLESQPNDFYKRTYNGYQMLIADEPERFVVIDGRKSLTEIKNQIWKHMLTLDKFKQLIK